MSSKLVLIVPCFNEVKRLHLEQWLALKNKNIHIVFANDGSSDRTLEALKSFEAREAFIHVFSSPVNLGKGHIIREAYQHIAKHESIGEFQYVGYWDCDLSTPLTEVERIMAHMESSKDKVIFGSRIRALGYNIVRYKTRHMAGRVFNFLVNTIFNLNSYDTQCGAKIMTKDLAEKAFSEIFVSSWLFDIEIVLRLKAERIVEIPLLSWEHRPGSKISLVGVLPKIIRDLIIIKKKYG
jgi:dolichyl-phosphate beta-glucosyltransferase